MSEQKKPKRGAVGKRKQVALENRRRMVARLFIQGLSQHQIIERLGLENEHRDYNAACVMVCNDLHALRRQWKESAVRDFDKLKAEQLARLRLLESELWEAWERSRRDSRQVQVQRRRRPPENPWSTEEDQVETSSTTTVSKAERDGNPAFTAQIRQCVLDQCELMGLMTKGNELGSAPPVVSFSIHESLSGEQPHAAEPSEQAEVSAPTSLEGVAQPPVPEADGHAAEPAPKADW